MDTFGELSVENVKELIFVLASLLTIAGAVVWVFDFATQVRRNIRQNINDNGEPTTPSPLQTDENSLSAKLQVFWSRIIFWERNRPRQFIDSITRQMIQVVGINLLITIGLYFVLGIFGQHLLPIKYSPPPVNLSVFLLTLTFIVFVLVFLARDNYPPLVSRLSGNEHDRYLFNLYFVFLLSILVFGLIRFYAITLVSEDTVTNLTLQNFRIGVDLHRIITTCLGFCMLLAISIAELIADQRHRLGSFLIATLVCTIQLAMWVSPEATLTVSSTLEAAHIDNINRARGALLITGNFEPLFLITFGLTMVIIFVVLIIVFIRAFQENHPVKFLVLLVLPLFLIVASYTAEVSTPDAIFAIEVAFVVIIGIWGIFGALAMMREGPLTIDTEQSTMLSQSGQS